MILPVLLAVACRGDFEADRAAQPEDSLAAVASMETLPPDMANFPQIPLDTVRVKMDSIEALLVRADPDSRPRLLFSLGHWRRLYIPEAGTSHGDWAAARPDEFAHNESGGHYIYTGKHLKQLLERYPRHELADDAAHELTLLPLGGECEGFVTCAIATEWIRVAPFLRDYPTSPYASRALDRAIAAFTEYLKDVPDLHVATESYDPAELRPLLASFDSVTAGLPPHLRAPARATSASLWQRIRSP